MYVLLNGIEIKKGEKMKTVEIKNWDISFPQDFDYPTEINESGTISGVLTNDMFSEELMTNMEYYYHRKDKYFFRNSLGKFTAELSTNPDLKFKAKYIIIGR